MNRLAIAVLLPGLGILTLYAGSQDTVAQQQERVEHGLRANITIGGKPSGPILERMRTLQVPGAGVAVIRNYRVEWAKGYGVRNAATGEPVTDATRFQVASITKPLTAVIALSLVEQGRLDLDRDVNAYLRSWKVPENVFTKTEKVTIRRLLSHTAGLTVRGFRGYPAGAPVPTLLQVLDGLPPANSEPIRVDQVPGTGFRYSGGGFTVLQQLLEDVTGQSLADLARERVFAPLGMTHSSIGVPPHPTTPLELSMAHVPNAVPGYRFLSGGSGCCEWWTTPTDLAKFALAIQRSLRGDTASVLSQATARMMVTPVAGGPTGLGFFVNDAGDTRYFEHSGGNPGFGSMLVATVEGGHGAVILENAGNTGGFVGEVLTSIGAVYGLAGPQTVSYQSSADLVAAYKRAKAIRPDDPMVAEGAVNALGYRLLRNHMREEAVHVFQLNTELYPDSANAEDSLAEAHESAGHLEAALAHYRLAIDKLDRHGPRNAGYERNRAAAQSKIADLTARVSKKPGR